MPNWTSAASLRNYLRGEPWLDWLNQYGQALGYVQDVADPNLDFGQFVREKGIAFESALFDLLSSRGFHIANVQATQSSRRYNSEALEETRRRLGERPDMIVGAMVAHTPTGLFGLPDLLIRADRLPDLYELDSDFAAMFGDPWRSFPVDSHLYLAADVKFSSLDLGAKGRMTPSSKPEYQAQVMAYSWGLGEMQGVEPTEGLLIGRLSKRDKFVRGNSCFGWPVLVASRDDKTEAKMVEALSWLERVRSDGATWVAEPTPTVPELAVGKVNEGFWHNATKQIRSTQRPTAAEGEFISTDLADGPWRTPAEVEFFVDFETFNNLDDDFTQLPMAGGQSLIFMIGCLHKEVFRCFIADDNTEEAEARIIDAWFTHMATVAAGRETRVLHWSNAEPGFFRTNYDSVANRHGKDRWPDPNWFDFLPVVKKGLTIRGVNGNGLKEVGKALFAAGLIATDWAEDGVFGGTAAQVAAWKAYRSSRETGQPVQAHEWMVSTERYNRADVEVMRDVIQFVRTLS